MRFYFLLLVCTTFLSGCMVTTNKSINVGYEKTPPQKGLLAVTLGEKTNNQANYFYPMNSLVYYKKSNTDELEQIIVYEGDFEETGQADYNKKDFLIELDVGTYDVWSAIPFNTAINRYSVVKSKSHSFSIREGAITYIGQYDVGTQSEGESIWSLELKKVTSHIRDNRDKNMADILKKYPNLKDYPISYEVPQNADFRTKHSSSTPTVVNFKSY